MEDSIARPAKLAEEERNGRTRRHAQFYLHSSCGFLQGTAKAKLDDLKIYLEMIYQPRMQRYRMPENVGQIGGM